MRGRLRRAGCAVLVVALAAAGAATSGPAAADDPPYVDWTPLLPGLSLGFAPSAERDCADGSNACIERTLKEMYRRFDRLYATCDHNSVFALVYIRVTEAIRSDVLRGRFEEPTFLNHEDAVFARMYFQAFDNWEAKRYDRVPGAWREAFDSAHDKRVNAFGNLMMSMNAHVNRDMPFMLAAIGQQQSDGSSRKPDHDYGNLLLSKLYAPIIEEVGARWDPTTRNYNLPLGYADDVVAFQVLPLWREIVWRNAELLRMSGAGARIAVGNAIEAYGASVGRTVRTATGVRDPGQRDAACRRYRATHRERGAEALPSVRRAGASARAAASSRCGCGARRGSATATGPPGSSWRAAGGACRSSAAWPSRGSGRAARPACACGSRAPPGGCWRRAAGARSACASPCTRRPRGTRRSRSCTELGCVDVGSPAWGGSSAGACRSRCSRASRSSRRRRPRERTSRSATRTPPAR